MVKWQQFDIFWIDLNPTRGAEIEKIRPCVIISPNELCYLKTRLIAPISSKGFEAPFRVNFTLENNIVIGKNKEWKQEINLGKKINQNFVSIPYNSFIEKMAYKCENYGIKLHLTEESYTSKCDHLANEPLEHRENYLGKRVKRGLFKSSIGKFINADLNGAIGIARKVFPDAVQTLRDSETAFVPLKISIGF